MFSISHRIANSAAPRLAELYTEPNVYVRQPDEKLERGKEFVKEMLELKTNPYLVLAQENPMDSYPNLAHHVISQEDMQHLKNNPPHIIDILLEYGHYIKRRRGKSYALNKLKKRFEEDKEKIDEALEELNIDRISPTKGGKRRTKKGGKKDRKRRSTKRR
jgi:hypothetical protein